MKFKKIIGFDDDDINRLVEFFNRVIQTYNNSTKTKSTSQTTITNFNHLILN